MKKIILTAMIVFAFGFANAQETKFGAKVALNIASLTGDVENASSLIAFQIGGFAEFKISEKFSIQPELMYSAQGVTKEGDSFEDNYKLAYLNIPVIAKFYATPKFSLEFGPQIGFLLSAKVDFTESGAGNESFSGTVDIKDEVDSIDFGLSFGAGYDITKSISAGVRYNLGLANIAETESGNNSELKNNILSMSLGYKF